MGNLYSMTYSDFCNVLQKEISRLTKSQVLRVSFLELGNEYIELTERNFHKVSRLVGTDTLRINIKVRKGSSPAPVNKVCDFICYDLCSSSGTYALSFTVRNYTPYCDRMR